MGKKRRRKPNVRRVAAEPAGRKAAPVTPKPRKLEAEGEDAEYLEFIAEKEALIYTMAYKRYLFESGGELEHLLENGQCSARAYLSQIRAEEEGGQGWGPNITPYEDRMNRSLQLRVIREKQKWIERCREQIIESMKEDYALRHEDEPVEPEEADEAEENNEPIEVEAGADDKPVLTHTTPAVPTNADGP